jgi:hypothetical protein
MRPALNAAAQVGRIGALAVALGVGAAVVAGQGVASADTGAGSGAKSSASSSSGSNSSSSASPGKRKTTKAKSPASTVSAKTVTTTTAAAATATPAVTSAATATATAAPAVNTSGTPAAPDSPAAWALLAAVRREFGLTPAAKGTTGMRTAAVTNSPVTMAAAPTATVVTTLPSSLPSTPTGWVTGVNNPQPVGLLTPYIPQTNNTSGFNIYGTDLGIMWDNMQTGDTHFILTAFGDTFSGPNQTGDWRSNVLLLSTDTKLYNGTTLLQTGPAYQFIPSSASALGLAGSEVTIIPTSGIAVVNGGTATQYVNYMSVKSWDTPGSWTTNYSAVSVYNPTTDKWVIAPSTIRSAGWFRSSTPYVAGSQNFQQAAYVLEPEDQVGEDGIRYLYAFGTPSGRQGSAYLSRVNEDDVTDLSQYEYWDGNSGTWVKGNPAVATAVVGSQNDTRPIIGTFVDIANDPNFFGGIFGGLVGAKQGGNVSEMSVQYNEYLGKYVMLYGDGNNNVEMRIADTPESTWSDPITIATSLQYPGLYAPMIHPWSGTGELTDAQGNPDVSNLYWNMSIWGDYNVVAMQTDLSSLKTTLV